jgi:superfamily I DNA/RNA helicase
LIRSYAGNPVAAYDKAVDFIHYADHVKKKYKKDPEKVRMKLENLTRLRDMIEALSEDSGMTVEDLIFQLTMDRSEVQSERGEVTISTIHSAKGLEWKNVFIFCCNEGLLPHRFSMSNDSEIEEEKRLWYVGVTRARDTCYVTVVDQVYLGKNLVDAEPSRFLAEIGIEVH